MPLPAPAAPTRPRVDANPTADRPWSVWRHRSLPALVAASPPEQGATYAAKLTKADQQLDWHQPAAVLARQVRAMAPRPGVGLL
ncbi:MAG: hypothetical protein ACK5GA_04910, partial [Holosporaceae bacterium]